MHEANRKRHSNLRWKIC